MLGVRRREFIGLLGGAAAGWPIAARSEQAATPVIGWLSAAAPNQIRHLVAAFREGLADVGYIERVNVAIEYRFADWRYDHLPALAADLIHKQVGVIVTGATIPTALAAKAATSAIPIVFGVGDDPTKLGLVASLARPGGNATGVNFFSVELGAKIVGLLHELLPKARRVGLLVNPQNPANQATVRDVTAAAPTISAHIDIIQATDGREIEAAFATLAHTKADALLIGPEALFYVRRVQLATLAARHAIPTVSQLREYTDAGGLMSYGADLLEVYRQMGLYTGRILKGAQPSDLPVVQSTRFELVINLSTARLLGIDVPPTLLARADEVIE
jgi:putative ABC transport system substrate-binding protein